MLPMQGARVPSLVGDLRSYMLCGMPSPAPTKKKRERERERVKNIGEDLEKLELSYTAVEIQNGTATLKNSLEVTQKLKYRT